MSNHQSVLVIITSRRLCKRHLLSVVNSDKNYFVPRFVTSRILDSDQLIQCVKNSHVVWVDGLKAGLELTEKLPKVFQMLVLRIFPKDLTHSQLLKRLDWSKIDVLVAPATLLTSQIDRRESGISNPDLILLEDSQYECRRPGRIKIRSSEFIEPDIIEKTLGQLLFFYKKKKVFLNKVLRGKKKDSPIKFSCNFEIEDVEENKEQQRQGVLICRDLSEVFSYLRTKVNRCGRNSFLVNRCFNGSFDKLNTVNSPLASLKEGGNVSDLNSRVKEVAGVIKSLFSHHDEDGLQFVTEIGRSKVEVQNIVNFLCKLILYEKRILHAPVNIANQQYELSKSLRKLGLYSRSLDMYPSWFGYPADWTIQPYFRLGTFREELLNHFQIFHFHFAKTLERDYSDLPQLKKHGKTIVMHYWGSDIRRLSASKNLNPYAVEFVDEKKNLQKLEKISRYVPCCIVGDRELYESVKDFHNRIYFLRQAIDLKKFDYCTNTEAIANEKITIVHAPSSFDYKGTKYIISAIEKLRSKHNFEFFLIHQVSHERLLRIIAQADLVIDQVLLGTYGLLAIESMALGKPVVAWIADAFLDSYPPELPIIRANPDNIEAVLDSILRDREILKDIGAKSRAYVEKYHNVEEIRYELLAIYYLESIEFGIK